MPYSVNVSAGNLVGMLVTEMIGGGSCSIVSGDAASVAIGVFTGTATYGIDGSCIVTGL